MCDGAIYDNDEGHVFVCVSVCGGCNDRLNMFNLSDLVEIGVDVVVGALSAFILPINVCEHLVRLFLRLLFNRSCS